MAAAGAMLRPPGVLGAICCELGGIGIISTGSCPTIIAHAFADCPAGAG